jgi:hypothetical protein
MIPNYTINMLNTISPVNMKARATICLGSGVLLALADNPVGASGLIIIGVFLAIA